MRVLPLILVIALAGCFGLPEGSADFGDIVTVRYVAVDPETGTVLESVLSEVRMEQVDGETHYQTPSLRNAVISRLGSVPPSLQDLMDGPTVAKTSFDRALADEGLLVRFGRTAEFELGLGEGPLGFAAERAMAGMLPNETQTIRENAPGYTGTQTAPRTIAGGDFVQVIPLNEFQFFFGPEPEAGMEFEYNVLHQARVQAVENNTVRIRVLAEEGQQTSAEFIGADIVTHVDESGYQYELVPREGERFIIQQPAQGQTPLGLPPGGYRTQGVEGDQIVYDYTPVQTTLADRDVEFIVELLAIESAQDAVPTGDYGQRRSPVLPGHHHEDEAHDHGDHDHGDHDH